MRFGTDPWWYIYVAQLSPLCHIVNYLRWFICQSTLCLSPLPNLAISTRSRLQLFPACPLHHQATLLYGFQSGLLFPLLHILPFVTIILKICCEARSSLFCLLGTIELNLKNLSTSSLDDCNTLFGSRSKPTPSQPHCSEIAVNL